MGLSIYQAYEDFPRYAGPYDLLLRVLLQQPPLSTLGSAPKVDVADPAQLHLAGMCQSFP